MPNIDTLSIQFNANGTDKAVNNIKAMGYAVHNLAQSIKSIDSSKLGAFTSSMETLKKSIPTEAQTNRMSSFSNAIKELSGVIGAANISGFSRDMSTLGDAVNTFKRSSVNSITNAVSAMQNLQSQTQATANVISNAVPKKSANAERGDNRAKTPSVDTTVAELDKIGSRVDAIKSKFKGIFVPTKQFKTLEEQANKIAKKYDELRIKMQEALKNGSMTIDDSSFKKQSAELDALRQQYNDLIQKQKELAQSGGGIVLNPALKSSLNAFHKGFSSVTNIIKNGFVAGIRHANSAIKSFASHVKQSATSLKNTVTGGHKATDMAKNFAKELLRVSKMLKLMVTRMALRAVIKEVGNGFKSLALHSDEFNNSMSNLINGSKKLGYSFAAMVAPLINALAPAIVYVINLLTKLINIIQQVFGALTGATTWNKAKDFTDSWADNIEAANKGAKELKKTVLGFDELNQLQDNKSSGGGGSNIADMFDTKDIEPKWKKFADWLKDMWKKGDFTDLGKAIGEWLLNALNSIPWSKIYRMAAKIGKSLSTLINGFVEVRELGYTIGKSLAKAINTAFYFLDDFVRNLHWKSIGQFIAETLNGLFENIKWNKIYSTVYYGVRGIASAIQEAIDTFHWDNISKTLINGIDIISMGIKEFFEGIEWGDLGSKMGDQLAKTIKDAPWKQVGQAIGDAIQAAIDWVAGFVEKIKADDVVKALSDFLSGIFERVDPQKAGETLGKILQLLIDTIKGFWEENHDDIKEAVKNFFSGLFSKVDKVDLMKIVAGILGFALLNGVTSLGITAIKSALAEKLKGAITSAGGSTLVTGASETAGSGAGESFCDGFGGFVGTYLGVDIYQKIRDTFKLESLKKDFEDGKIKINEYMDSLKNLGSLGQSQGATAALDLFIEKSDALKEKFQLGQITIDEYKKKLGDLNAEYDTLGQSREELQKHADAVVDSIVKTTRHVDAEDGAVKTHTGTWKDFWKALFDGDSSTSAIEAFKNIRTSVDDDIDALNNLAKQNEDTTKSFEIVSAGAAKISFEPLKKNIYTLDSGFKTATDNMSKNSKVVTANIPNEMANAGVSMAGTFRTLSQNVDTETKKGFDAAGKNSEVFTKNMPKNVSDAQKSMTISVEDLRGDFSTNMSDIQKAVSDSTDEINKSFASVKDGMSEDEWTFSGVWNGLTKTFENAKQGIKGIWNDIADTLNGEHTIFNSSFKINLPRFASGGFPRENGLFLANSSELVGKFSNGKTAVANNEQITQGIAQAVYNAIVSAQSSNSGQYINNTIMLDGDVLARAVTKGQDRLNRRYSPTSV